LNQFVPVVKGVGIIILVMGGFFIGAIVGPILGAVLLVSRYRTISTTDIIVRDVDTI